MKKIFAFPDCKQHTLVFLYLVFILVAGSCSCREIKEKNNLKILADTARLLHHLDTLTQFNRNYQASAQLDSAADYIKSEFAKYSKNIEEQMFLVFGGVVYKNIICSFGPRDAERIIVGAHYDVCGNQPGADDNASGVSGLLELARLFDNDSLKYRIDLVAYTLEEPPFFGTKYMGSYIHAKSLYDNKVPVKGMISLEMIGYFNDAENSQDYPLGLLKWFYGNKGNYILVVQKYNNGKFGREFKEILQKEHSLPTRFFKGPSGLAGANLSDHRNFWYFGYSAVMVTNTAFYRNKNYHTVDDKAETLDIKRMGLVIDEVYNALKKIN
jgi:hypothetical protein